MSYYAGIGSRETPIELKEKIKTIVEFLGEKGYTLRSGGANGADSFFEEYSNKKEIFLPWKDFNGNKSLYYEPTKEAYDVAKLFHPNWNKLSFGGKKLMARNCHQVLGYDLKTPVKFIICWTRDGKASGGTGQALRIAEKLGIPVYNLFFEENYNKIFKEVV